MQLIIVENWPISHYPIKNGSVFIVDLNHKYHPDEASFSSTQPLSKVEEQDEYNSEKESTGRLSFLSNNGVTQAGKSKRMIQDT